MRGAMMLMDYSPDPAEVEALRGLELRRGVGGLPEEGVAAGEQHWAMGTDVEFAWEAGEAARRHEPLRGAIAEGGAARAAMLDALGSIGYFQQPAQEILQKGAAALDALNDEDLFLTWLRADRAIMAGTDDLQRATREGLLLAGRRNDGPAILFTSGGQHVYLLPMDGAAGRGAGHVGADGSVCPAPVEMDRRAADGRLPRAPRVRAMAARMAELAAGETEGSAQRFPGTGLAWKP